MGEIVLRIFFSGLMAFVPAKDGKELTILILNTPHEMKLSDGSLMPHHMPMLLVRAANCEPAPCPARDADIARFLFAKESPDRAADALQAAVAGGGAWQLASSDLSISETAAPLDIVHGARVQSAGKPSPVPMTPAERADFSWVPHLTQVMPGLGEINPDLLGDHPPAALVAGRLRLRSGSVMTYSMIRVDGKVRPIHFRSAKDAADVPFSQALANWVVAEIHVPRDSVELVDTNFETGAKRTIRLRPQGNLVEMAILNLPPFVAPAADAKLPLPKRGQHFEIYYDLMTTPPARGSRPVPDVSKTLNPADPQVESGTLYPKQASWSDLLDRLGMSARGKRAPYDLVLCPGTQIP